jgi:hypothetical protein
MEWVLNSEGEPYLCPIRGTNCSKRCALYGTASVEKMCAFSVIAEALTQIFEQGLEVNKNDGDQ